MTGRIKDELSAAQAFPPPAPSPAPEASRRLIPLLALANFGLMTGYMTPLIVSLQLRVEALAPHQKAAMLSATLGVGAVFGIAVNPIAGRLSDRTTSRFGRRRPWLAAGAALGLLGLALVAVAPSMPVLIAGWCVAQAGFNTALAALTALVPDQIPPERRGTAAGWFGVGQALAALVGTSVATALTGTPALAVIVPGVATVAGIGLLCLKMSDRPCPADAARPPLDRRAVIAAFWVSPRRHPDFGWAWISRFAMFMSIASVLNYQLFYLGDQLGLSHDRASAVLGTGVAVQTVAAVVGSVLFGRLSDRSGRRKPFVAISACAISAGLVLLAVATELPLYFAGMVLVGVGQGAYLAVDLALAADVLPDRDADAAKDLGVFNIASQLPQSAAPAFAPVILAVSLGSLSHSSDNYTALFGLGAVFAVASALTVTRVRATR